MADDQAYIGAAPASAAGSDYNAMSFIVSQILGRIGTNLLVEVVAVYPDLMQVDLHPIVNQLDAENNAIPHGTIFGCPYMRHQAGGCAIILDPVIGDKGMAFVCSHDISSAKATKSQANPGSRRRFDLADAVYLGGILNGEAATSITMTGDTIAMVAPGGVTINGVMITAGGDVIAADAVSLHNHTHLSNGDGAQTDPPTT